MQRMVFLAVLAVLTVLAGCAARDPNLTVRGLGEFGHTAGDYTLNVSVYDLDAEGRPRLVAADDASLRGFVTRTLSAKGYVAKAQAPARYALEVHLLCGSMRQADKGLLGEELKLPAAAAGPGYSPEIHFWRPDKVLGSSSHDLRDSMQSGRTASGADRPTRNPLGGTPLGRQKPLDPCQGRVLVTLTPASAGAQREVFVGRAATDDCRAVTGCPVDTCRTALEQSLVDMLERRF